MRFSFHFGFILDPQGDPKIVYFSVVFAPVVALAPSWRQEGPQSAPRQPRKSILLNFLPFWGRFWSEFWWLSMPILLKFRGWFCMICLYFLQDYMQRHRINSKFQSSSFPILQFPHPVPAGIAIQRVKSGDPFWRDLVFGGSTPIKISASKFIDFSTIFDPICASQCTCATVQFSHLQKSSRAET